MNNIISSLKSQIVLIIAFLVAVVSAFFVPPNKEYFSYIDFSVISMLFCLMVTVAGFRSIGIFESITNFLLERVSNVRKLGFILMNVCFFSSMLVTNDVALITFVPLTIILFSKINNSKDFILTVVIETAAANLGSMLTPIGNPQNLFIYSHYNLGILDFFRIMTPLGILSYILLSLVTLLLSKQRVISKNNKITVSKKYFIIYSIMFVICLTSVLRIIPTYICLITILVLMLITNYRLILKVDYSLLLTFICFFIFVGNMGKIEVISNFIIDIMEHREIIVSALLSQIISNVPATVMLSEFTDNFTSLLKGVNIGGLGTPVASLASLISYKFYAGCSNAKKGKYLLVFSIVNFTMLAILLIFNFFGMRLVL